MLKNKWVYAMLIMSATALSFNAAAGPHHHGGGHHGGYYRGHPGIGFYFGSPYYPRPYYPYSPYYYPYYPPEIVTVPVDPPVYIERERSVPQPQQLEEGYWYYCNNPAGYYPYIKECADGWRQVEPTPQN
jgi:hypothetical protein